MLNRELKTQVFARDNYRCKICGEDKMLSVDHIMPVELGGKDTLDNLQTLCDACNSKKGSYVQLTFWQKLKFIWNVDVRIKSNDINLSNIFSSKLRLKANVNDMEVAKKNIQHLNKEIGDAKNMLNGKIIEDRRQLMLKLVGMENDLAFTKREVEDTQRVMVDLIKYLNLRYTPRGFKELP